MKEKPYNNGQWTQARFNSFIKSALRAASNRWGPKGSVLKKARIKRGLYRCAGWRTAPHIVNVSVGSKGSKKRNIMVDHIIPIINPNYGFVSWDDVIKKMFVEENGLQVLCKKCHDNKTKEEREKRK
jgi:5-methylcytosine-specific restriction endonuclease McrA